MTPSATAAAVFYAVSTHVEELGRDRIHPVFLLDEARLLHQDVLDHLHILLNYQWDSCSLLSLVLVGLPELENQLERRRNRSLYSRIHHRFAIDDASAEDITEYVAYRPPCVRNSCRPIRARVGPDCQVTQGARTDRCDAQEVLCTVPK